MNYAYDCGLVWDANPGLTWDMTPAGNHNKTMVRVRKTIRTRKLSDIRTRLQAVYDGLNGNANFPTPTPALTGYNTKLQAIDAKLTDISNAELALDGLREDRDALFGEAELVYSQLGSYVENTSGDDRAKALTSGFEVIDDAPAPPPPLVQVANLAATTGDNDGELDAQWQPQGTADAYEVQTAPDPLTGTGWVHATTVGVSKVTLTGLPNLAKRWVRVRAIRSTDKGPWSDPACAVVS